jgi:hypothetical protein
VQGEAGALLFGQKEIYGLKFFCVPRKVAM